MVDSNILYGFAQGFDTMDLLDTKSLQVTNSWTNFVTPFDSIRGSATYISEVAVGQKDSTNGVAFFGFGISYQSNAPFAIAGFFSDLGNHGVTGRKIF